MTDPRATAATDGTAGDRRSSLATQLLWSIQQPDQFAWFSRYLEHHGLATPARWLISLTTLLLGVAAEVAMLSPQGPQSMSARLVTLGVGIAIVGLAGMWWVRPWPTRRQSLIYAVVSDICIGAACVTHAGLLAGTTGCVAFAALGGYIGFFHGARLMLAHLAFATATVLYFAVLIAIDGDPALAVAKFILITIANFTVPVGMLISVQLLNTDAAHSHTDPLTGLLNRRGLDQAWPALVARSRVHDEALIMLVIDLDDFKSVNDTYGHAAGDDVLVGVATAIREVCRRDAVIARTGGEEFAVADTIRADTDAAHHLLARISTAIATAPTTPAVTASIGYDTRSLTGHDARSSPAAQTLAAMINTADANMYDAKAHRYIHTPRRPGPGSAAPEETHPAAGV